VALELSLAAPSALQVFVHFNTTKRGNCPWFLQFQSEIDDSSNRTGGAHGGAYYPDDGSAFWHIHDNVAEDLNGGEWLFAWNAADQHDLTVDTNFVDTKKFVCASKTCTVDGTATLCSKQGHFQAGAIFSFCSRFQQILWNAAAIPFHFIFN
jgi:hypothetical protein